MREQATVPWRVYRPAIVVGDSRTGHIDKVDGPYYLFELIRRLAVLPGWMRLPGPDLGATNVVPVDYVVDAMDHIMHVDHLDGRAFHLVNPRPQPVHKVFNAFAAAAGAPRLRARRSASAASAPRSGSPAGSAASPVSSSGATSRSTRWASRSRCCRTPRSPARSTTPRPSPRSRAPRSRCPTCGAYAPVLWRYWEENLDRDRGPPAAPGRDARRAGGS